MFLNGLSQAYVFRLSSIFFNQTIQFLLQINVKNVHAVYVADIQTHNLQIVSLIPQPLDQGTNPANIIFCFCHNIYFTYPLFNT